jgi:hypothetical protein
MRFLSIPTALLLVLLAGCASSHVLVGKKRPPITPEQVQIYLQPPTKYEVVALVEASSKSSWAVSDQGKMNKVIERLKIEAAALGANGLLLQGTGSESTGTFMSGTGTTINGQTFGTGYGFAALHKIGSAHAIHVEK